jgi:hypothetical protein
MIDQIKAYTRRIMDMKYIPVFDEFCFFRPYKEGTALDDYSIYLVKSPKQLSSRDLLIFDRTYVLTTGLTLKETRLHNKCTILYKATPVKLVPNTIKSTIRDLWDSELPDCDQKFIMNMCIGWCDKKFNKKTRCEYFDDEAEANCNKLNKPTASILCFKPGIHNADETPLHLVVDKRQCLMDEGFMPMSIFKYDAQRL